MTHTHTYTIEKVAYGAKGRRWTFEAPGYSFATPRMPGGRETAVKIARAISDGNKRMEGKGIDNLARSNMSTIFHNAAKATSRVVSPIGTFYND